MPAKIGIEKNICQFQGPKIKRIETSFSFIFIRYIQSSYLVLAMTLFCENHLMNLSQKFGYLLKAHQKSPYPLK